MGLYLGHLETIAFDILLNDAFQLLLPKQGHHRLVVLIQAQETCIAIDHWLVSRSFPLCYDPVKAFFNLRCHGHISDTTFCFRLLDDVLHLTGVLELINDLDAVLLKLNPAPLCVLPTLQRSEYPLDVQCGQVYDGLPQNGHLSFFLVS